MKSELTQSKGNCKLKLLSDEKTGELKIQLEKQNQVKTSHIEVAKDGMFDFIAGAKLIEEKGSYILAKFLENNFYPFEEKHFTKLIKKLKELKNVETTLKIYKRSAGFVLGNSEFAVAFNRPTIK